MANLIQHTNVKSSKKTGHTKANAKKKQPRSDIKSQQRPKSVAMSISIPISKISAIVDNAFDLNQAYLTTTSFFSYETVDTYLSICKEVNM